MIIGLYTSQRYFDLKKAALEETIQKLGIDAALSPTNSFRPSFPAQTFGFEEMFRRARTCAAEAIVRDNTDIGIGIENSLSFIYNADVWYYVIGVSVQTKDERHAESFTSGIMVPQWMIKQVQENNMKMDDLTQSLAGEADPVVYFSGGKLTRKDLMVPALLLAFTSLNLDQSTVPTTPVPKPAA
jgi:non-canonical (house-cleaning) NTP pyrophosphatase